MATPMTNPALTSLLILLGFAEQRAAKMTERSALIKLRGGWRFKRSPDRTPGTAPVLNFAHWQIKIPEFEL
jgi:hypothetical protein